MDTLSKRERRRLLTEWAQELGGDLAAVRRVCMVTQAAIDAAMAGRDVPDADHAARLDAKLCERASGQDTSSGRVLRALRTQTGETSDAVARATLVATSRMAEYERGVVQPTLAVALRLWRHYAAQLPGLRFEEVFGGELAAGAVAARCEALREAAKPSPRKKKADAPAQD